MLSYAKTGIESKPLIDNTPGPNGQGRLTIERNRMVGPAGPLSTIPGMTKRATTALNDQYQTAARLRGQRNLTDFNYQHALAEAGNAMADQSARSQSTMRMLNYLLGREQAAGQQAGSGLSLLSALMGQA